MYEKYRGKGRLLFFALCIKIVSFKNCAIAHILLPLTTQATQWGRLLAFVYQSCLCSARGRSNMASAEEGVSPVTWWSCCSVLDSSSEHKPGWRSAGGLLGAPRPPASSGSRPLWVAASPAWRTSRFLGLGATLCSCCSALQVGKSQGKKKYVREVVCQSFFSF